MTEEGTFLNVENLLKDTTAALLGLSATAVPDDAFVAIKNLINSAINIASIKANVATGSYKGTDKKGASNKNSLTFDFEPKLVLVQSTTTLNFFGVFIYGMPQARTWWSDPMQTATVTWNGTTVSWYASDEGYQLNSSYHTYNYVAIG